MTERVFNFSAGPAVLPEAVLKQAQQDLFALPGVGMSVLEISHRSAAFEQIIAEAEADLRALLAIPDNYKVLFLQGGASMQFTMVPMNLLSKSASADYLTTGSWGQAAVKEAKKLGTVREAANTSDTNFNRLPNAEEIKLDPQAAYVHFTSNETIFGVEFQEEPHFGDATLVCDMSSNFISKPVDVARYGLIYAGAQKNAGPAGATIVIVREDLLASVPEGLPAMLDYRNLAKNGSMYNTPPCFAIYLCGLVFKWALNEGGLAAMQAKNAAKAKILYDAIDASDNYYRGHAQRDCRSLMNVTFRLPSEDLEKKFIKEATAAKLDGLKGHRSVGGLRASIYNAFPQTGVERLVEFMGEFQRNNG
ncbi:MAG: 3-phosphoserine/phosphohydroxythreonine transaminase [Acidobacteria bacterium]|nr:3-phosphoserine/phosphohydroxythreonine transaminase [Acidobacteriota bacterium]MBI3422729.1 3-phosphoserine/phosphohydroxythreonine transaminase [Acidobacteriota bacterium]